MAHARNGQNQKENRKWLGPNLVQYKCRLILMALYPFECARACWSSNEVYSSTLLVHCYLKAAESDCVIYRQKTWYKVSGAGYFKGTYYLGYYIVRYTCTGVYSTYCYLHTQGCVAAYKTIKNITVWKNNIIGGIRKVCMFSYVFVSFLQVVQFSPTVL